MSIRKKLLFLALLLEELPRKIGSLDQLLRQCHGGKDVYTMCKKNCCFSKEKAFPVTPELRYPPWKGRDS